MKYDSQCKQFLELCVCSVKSRTENRISLYIKHYKTEDAFYANN